MSDTSVGPGEVGMCACPTLAAVPIGLAKTELPAHVLGKCARCGQDIWVGPKQATTPYVKLCPLCTVIVSSAFAGGAEVRRLG